MVRTAHVGQVVLVVNTNIVEREKKAELQKLMVRLADGDRDAFSPMYEMLWPIVCRFAGRALNGSPEAEDAAQVALMKVFSRASKFDPDRDALLWVLGITAYECKTFRQKHRRRRESTGIDLVQTKEKLSPENVIIELRLKEAMIEILGTLRATDMETLEAVMEGRRPEMPAATFRKRVERAVNRLRAAWSSRHGLD